MPPYNCLLGGKLISYILASKELREIYFEKYKDQITLKERRKACELVGFFTTSLYGKSSQYNRLKFKDKLLYQPIGRTKGFGTIHLSEATIHLMVDLIKSKGINVGNKFGDGPSWVMRIIRSAGDILGFDSDFLLRHSFKRNIYFVSLAKNYREFLNSEINEPDYFDYTKDELVNFWKTRWLFNRKKNFGVIKDILDFTPKDFQI